MAETAGSSNSKSAWVRRVAIQLLLLSLFSTFMLMYHLHRTPAQDSKDPFSTKEEDPHIKGPLGNSHAKNADDPMKEINKKELEDTWKFIRENFKRRPDDLYNYNVTASDHISFTRHVVDSRPPGCSQKVYNIDELPTATVIIPFHNEAMSMLLRTVHSILGRSPPKLLKEIIMIDDASKDDILKKPLDMYVKLLPSKVKLVRNKKRMGLIRARMKGADMAKGEVIIFQDGHTECNVGWLEPLLAEIKADYRKVLQPSIDAIETYDIGYIGSSGTVPRGGFSWDLRYTWMALPEHERARLKSPSQTQRTPTLVGCSMAVQKDYFNYIGRFDPGMNIWGGENLELAWRTWMCGGQALTVVCSRVAHIFKPFSYAFDGDREKIVQKNLMRVAELWMGDYKQFFYAATRIYDFRMVEFDQKDLASLEERKEFKRNLKCKSFDWYLQNIVPEMTAPPLNVDYFGELSNKVSEQCFYVMSSGYVGITGFCYYHRIVPENNFYLDRAGRLKYRTKCVVAHKLNYLLRLEECTDVSTQGIWEVEMHGSTWAVLKTTFRDHDGKKKQLCAMHITNKNTIHYNEQMAQVVDCVKDEKWQLWRWTYRFDFSKVPKGRISH